MTAYRRVLVGTDGSESSFRAVDRAADIAAASGAQLLLLTAYRASAKDSSTPSGADGGDAVLRAAVGRVGDRVSDVDTLCVEAEPVDALVTAAQEREVDLLVVGNRGLNSLLGRVLGSVPSVAAHRAPCDILIVHTT